MHIMMRQLTPGMLSEGEATCYHWDPCVMFWVNQLDLLLIV